MYTTLCQLHEDEAKNVKTVLQHPPPPPPQHNRERQHNIALTSYWVRCRLKSPAAPLFTQPFIQVQIKENIKVPRHWPLCGEFTEDRWIPRTNGQQRGKCFDLMTSSWNGKKMSSTNHRRYIFKWPPADYHTFVGYCSCQFGRAIEFCPFINETRQEVMRELIGCTRVWYFLKQERLCRNDGVCTMATLIFYLGGS